MGNIHAEWAECLQLTESKLGVACNSDKAEVPHKLEEAHTQNPVGLVELDNSNHQRLLWPKLVLLDRVSFSYQLAFISNLEFLRFVSFKSKIAGSDIRL